MRFSIPARRARIHRAPHRAQPARHARTCRVAAGAVGAVALASASPAAQARETERRAPLTAYAGLAAWIDIYDPGPWQRPERTVRALARRGVATLFVQTSNYRGPRALQHPAALARLLASAHRRGLRVVDWYLPGFADLTRDWQRVRAAVRYRSPGGHRFDGFTLDIEATAVRDIAERNRRMLALSDRLRRLAGARYTLGAIIPDPVSQRYWPRFPYRALRARYDAFLPMAYWTPSTRGRADVRRRTCRALRLIRDRTGDARTPIHIIGGIAGHASAAEVDGFARAASACRATGASLYDAPITSAAQWQRIAPVRRLG